jgi:lysophospholipase L1-like esterase
MTLLLLSLASCTGEDPPPTYYEEKDPEVREPPLTSPEEKNSPSVSSEEEEAPVTYISLGDSLAVGVGASDPRNRGYAPLYRDLLERETGREVRLIGLGVSGETTESFINGPNSQLTQAERVLKDNPNAILTLSLGANDLLAEAGGTDREREQALTQYARNLDHILKALNNASTTAPKITVLALYNPAPGSFTDEWAGRLNAQIRDVAEENGASVAAGDEVFEGQEAEYTHYARDPYDIHPTDEGYEALARAFIEAP